MNLKKLKFLINKYNIKTDSWKKSIENLLRELIEGSTILKEYDGKLIREVKVAVIFISADNKTFYAEKNSLVLTEKLNKNESFEQACFRGLYEELGIKKNLISEIQSIGNASEEKDSYSYPGINTLYSYEAFYVLSSYAPKLTHIDHDGEKLQFKKIKITDFKHPNSLFISHFINYFFSTPRTIEETKSVFGDFIKISRATAVFVLYQKINSKILMRITRRRWHDLNLISTHASAHNKNIKLNKKYIYNNSFIDALIDEEAKKIKKETNTDILSNICSLYKYKKVPKGENLWKAFLSYDFYDRNKIYIKPKYLKKYSKGLFYLQISEHEKTLTLYHVILFHLDKKSISLNLIQDILLPDGILQIKESDLKNVVYGVFQRRFSHLSKFVNKYIKAYNIKVKVIEPIKIPGIFIISNFRNPFRLNKLIKSLDGKYIHYIPVFWNNDDHLGIFVFPNCKIHSPSVKKIMNFCLEWISDDPFALIYVNLEYISINDIKYIPEAIILSQTSTHDFLGYRCLEKNSINSKKYSGLFIEYNVNTAKILLGDFIQFTNDECSLDKILDRKRNRSFKKKRFDLKKISDEKNDYLSITISDH